MVYINFRYFYLKLLKLCNNKDSIKFSGLSDRKYKKVRYNGQDSGTSRYAPLISIVLRDLKLMYIIL